MAIIKTKANDDSQLNEKILANDFALVCGFGVRPAGQQRYWRRRKPLNQDVLELAGDYASLKAQATTHNARIATRYAAPKGARAPSSLLGY